MRPSSSDFPQPEHCRTASTPPSSVRAGRVRQGHQHPALDPQRQLRTELLSPVRRGAGTGAQPGYPSFSNTTEAGISHHADDQFDDAPPGELPGQLTRLLFERFSQHDGDADRLGAAAVRAHRLQRRRPARAGSCATPPVAVAETLSRPGCARHNTFCSTSVDRIVTGFPGTSTPSCRRNLAIRQFVIPPSRAYYLLVIQGAALHGLA